MNIYGPTCNEDIINEVEFLSLSLEVIFIRAFGRFNGAGYIKAGTW